MTVMTGCESLPVVVVGDGGHASVVISSLNRLGVEILGATGEGKNKKEKILDVPIIGNDDEITKWSPEEIRLVNGIGMTAPGFSQRHACAERLRVLGFRFLAVVDPTAVISPDVTISEGVQVMAGAVIQPGVYIGQDAIVNTGARIDHDCLIGDGCHICPGATLAGSITVGEQSVVGAGATIIPNVRISERSLVRAGSLMS
jgi:UDP-perosamine 4-acetyltransferase